MADIIGDQFDNQLTGTSDNDRLEGGLGNDTLIGGDGSDTYVFNRGDGSDLIDDEGNGDVDVVQLVGYNLADVIFTQINSAHASADNGLPKGDTLVLTFVGTSDRLEVFNTLDDSPTDQIESFVFDDQTLTIVEIRALLIQQSTTDGDDIINGFSTDDTLEGGQGNDTIYGVSGDDTLTGGVGDDTLIGGDGSDTYVFNRGDGSDLIDDEGNGDVDVVQLVGYNLADVIFTQINSAHASADNGLPKGDTLVLTFVGTSDRLEVFNTLDDSPTDQIESFVFDDQTLTIVEIRALLIQQSTTDGDDIINGFSTDDTLEGGQGNDTIYGVSGDDTLTGGVGDDTLIGGGGSDTYVFNRGDGSDLIDDEGNGDTDVVQLVGYNLADVIFTQINSAHASADNGLPKGDTLVLTFVGTSDRLEVFNTLDDAPTDQIESFVFDDQTLTIVEIRALLIQQSTTDGDDIINGFSTDDTLEGGQGNDTIYGVSGDDTLTGGVGDDTLIGGDGSDTYVFNRGDGSDLIDDEGNGDTDVVQLVGYNLADVIFTQINSAHASADNGLPKGDTLVLTFVGTSDRLEVFNTLDDAPTDQIESFVFDDQTLTIVEIRALLIQQSTTDGDDIINGFSTDDTLEGGQGNDTIYGVSGDDTLTGGVGDDTLIGGDGSDTYVFNRGDGSDLIDDEGNGDADVVQLVGYNLADVIFTQINSAHATADNGLPEGDTLVLTFVGTSDRLEVFNTLDDAPTDQIESFVFDDQTLSIAEIKALMAEGQATSGDDNITGSNGNDVIDALAGNDIINAGAGNDTITGGLGDDTIEGGSNSDTYIYNRGDGNDTYTDASRYESNNFDKVVLNNIDPTDVTVTRDNNDFILTISESVAGAGDGGTIRLVDTVNDNSGRGLERITFGNDPDTIWGRDELRAFILAAAITEGDDNIIGTTGHETIDALGGNDTINAGAGNDTITGGLGDDTIEGGSNSDTYIYNRGDGNDTYTDASRYESNNFDKVVLNNIDPTDVTVTRDNNDFILTISESVAGAGDGGTIRLVDTVNDNSGRGLERITFGNDPDTIWGRDELRAFILAAAITEGDDNIIGTTGHETIDALGGNDTINAGAGNDTITGGLGDDTIEGGSNSDTYIYNRGDGNDTYTDASRYESNNFDKVVLNNIDPTDVTVTRDNNDFILTISESVAGAGDGGTIRLVDTVNDDSGRGLERITFGNDPDTIWGRDELRAFILAAAITEGDDNIIGTTGHETIDALGGNDTINAGAGNDTITGGLGDDTIEGGSNSDTYIYNRGDGNDTYTDASRYESNNIDKVVLNNIDPTDVTVTRDNNDFILTISESVAGAGDGGTIRLVDTVNDDSGRGLERITFGNDPDTIWGRDELRAFILAAAITEGDDNIIGTTGHETIDALGGNDTINAGAGNDTITGGLGDDTIEGGSNSDTYIYNRGDGNDTYTDASRYESNNIDKVVLNNIDPTDVTVTRDNNDFILTISESVAGAGDGGTIRLVDTVNDDSGRGLERITFGNDPDTIWGRDELRAFILAIEATEGDDNITGTSGHETIDALGGNDTINAGAGNDTITGGLGDDMLLGGDGSDTYIFNRGDGSDFIYDNGYNDTDALTVVGYDLAEVNFEQINSGFGTDDDDLLSGDTLVLTFNGTTDRIEIFNTLDDSTTDQIESFVFDDQTLTIAEVKTRLANHNPIAIDDEFSTKTSDLLTITTAALLANDTDENSDSLTIISVQDAVNGTVAFNSEGEIEFTPSSEFTGDATFTYTISDGRNGTDIGTVTIDVVPDNRPPIVGNIDLGNMVEGDTLTISDAQLLAEASDIDGDELSISAVSVDAADGSIVDNGDGTYTFTPAADKIAYNININFTVSDGTLEAQAQAVIDVLPNNFVPVVENPIADTASDEDTAFSYTIDASTFSDADGDALTLSASLSTGRDLPSWLSFDADTATFSGEPPENFNGDLTVLVTASDEFSSASDLFTITINPVNDRPDVVADEAATGNSEVLSGNVLTNDSDVDGDELSIISIEGVTADIGQAITTASGALITLNADGSYLFNPNGVYDSLLPDDETSETIFYTVSDGAGGEVTSTLNISINGPTADLILSNLSLESGADGEQVQASFTITNQGAADAEGWADNLYISADQTLSDDDILLGSYGSFATLEMGQSISRTVSVNLPDLPGQFWLIGETNSSGAVTETPSQQANNIQVAETVTLVTPEYTATVNVVEDITGAGTPVTLIGSAVKSAGGPAAFEFVKIFVTQNGFTNEVDAFTDADGNFEISYRPLPGTIGTFTVNATHPGNPDEDETSEDSFDVLGLNFNIDNADFNVVEGETKSFTLTLENPNNVQLTGLSAQINGAPADWIVTVTSEATTAANSTTAVSLEVTIPEGSPTELDDFEVVVTSTEGTIATLPVGVAVTSIAPVLEASVPSIVAGMQRGELTYVTFDVTNTGATASSEITIDLPNAEWLGVSSGETISSLAPGETVTVTLSLMPDDDLPLLEYEGSLALNMDGGFLDVPFTFRAVSDATGELSLSVVDEYFYFAEDNPILEDAIVKLRDPFTGEIVYENSDVDGSIQIDDLPEGFYRLEVGADGHSTYRDTIEIKAGETTSESAFLSVQAVSYEWSVEQIEIEDRYEINVSSTFQTDVPIPVVVMDPPVLDFQDLVTAGQSIDIPVTWTNHGLIAAHNLEIGFSNSDSYLIEPQIDNLDTLDAKSSITFNVRVTRLDNESDEPESGSAAPSLAFDGNDLSDDSASLAAFDAPPAPAPASDGGGGGGGCIGGISGIYLYEYECAGKNVVRNVKIPVVTVTGPAGPCGDFYLDTTATATGSISVGNPVGFAGGNLCDIPPCIPEIIKLLVCATPISPIVDCGFGLASGDPLKAVQDCMPSKSTPLVGCAFKVISLIQCLKDSGAFGGEPQTRFADALSADEPEIALLQNLRAAPNGATISDGINNGELAADYQDFLMFALAYKGIITEIYGDSKWGDVSEISESAAELLGNFETLLRSMEENDSPSGVIISEEELETLLAHSLLTTAAGQESGITEADVRYAVERINNTNLIERDLEPTGDVENHANRGLLDQHLDTITALNVDAVAAGYDGIHDQYIQTDKAFRSYAEDYLEATNSNSVCAKVKIEIDQDAVLTRNAFSGTLVIENDHDADLSGIEVVLEIRDTNGDLVSTEAFGIDDPRVTGISAIDGTGVLSGGEEGRVEFTIIPTREAAPEAATEYTIGGRLSYVHEGIQVDIPLAGDPVTVLPQAELTLHYFHQRDVFSDDPFTDEIETAVPYQLGLLVENVGAGDATDFSITSNQPKIVDNEKGLLIDFDIIGTSVQGESVRPSLTVDFGDIAAGETAVGTWLLKSSLQGNFIEYDVTFEHVNSLGLPELSLITDAQIHELIHTVDAEDQRPDGLSDFLVDENDDLLDTPDTVYFSDGGTDSVYASAYVVTDGSVIGIDDTDVDVTALVNSGWNYFNVLDPVAEGYDIEAVLRSDGSSVDLDNVWQTDRTFPKFGEVTYENKIHIFDWSDAQGEATYTVVYSAGDTDAPFVITADEIADYTTDQGITNFDITFSELLADDSFGVEDVSLTLDGTAVSLDDGVSVVSLGDNLYRINNLQNATLVDGSYTLSVDLSGVTDLFGNAGSGTLSDDWIKSSAGLIVTDITGFSEYQNDSVDALTVTLSQDIDLTSVSVDDIELNVDGVSVDLSGAVITANGSSSFIVSGLADIAPNAGNYEFSVNATGINSSAGGTGINSLQAKWVIDRDAPMVIISGVVSAPRNVAVSTLTIVVTEETQTPLTLDDFELSLDGTAVSFGDAQLEKTDDITYELSGLSGLQDLEGEYTLSFVGEVSDLAGNVASTTAVDWELDRTAPELVGEPSVTRNEDGTITIDGGIDSLNTTILVSRGGTVLGQAEVTGEQFSITIEPLSGVQTLEYSITDEAGNRTIVSLDIDVDTTNPVLIEFINVDEEVSDEAFDSIDFQLSEQINLEAFDLSGVTLTKDGTNLIDNSISIVHVDDNLYRLTGLSNILDGNGAYVLEIAGTSLIDLAGNAGDGISSQVFTVAFNQAPQLDNPTADQTSEEDTAVSFSLPENAFSDVDGDDLTLSAKLEDGSDLPEWLAFDPNDGSFSGTPPLNFNGALMVTVTAADAGGLEAYDTFELNITPVNDAPQLDNPTADQTSEEDTAVSFSLPENAFSDVDGDDLTLSAKLEDGSDLPEWLAFDPNDGSFSGTPPLNFNGALMVTVTAADAGGLEAYDTFELNITPVNDAPQLDNPTADQTSEEDTAVSFSLPENAFSDVDGDDLTLSAKLEDGSDLPEWLAFDPNDGSFSGTPPLNFNGALMVTVTAADAGGLEAYDTFELNITPVNDAPQLDNPTADQTSEEDTAVSFSLPENAFSDVDGDDLTLSAKLEDGSDLPEWLAFDPNDGSFSGTPPLNFNGALMVTVTAADAGGLEAYDTFELNITPVNDAPQLDNPTADQTSEEDTAVSFSLPENAFSDVDGDDLTLSAKLEDGSDLPEWLAFDPNDGSFSGTPPLNFNGALMVTVTAADAGGLEAYDTFELNITPVNDAPQLDNPTADQTSEEDTAVSFSLPENAFSDVDGDDLTLSAKLEDGSDLPEWLAFDPNDGSFSGTPPLNFNGALMVTVTAADAGGLEAYDTFELNITPVNDAPQLDNPTADQTSEEDTAVSFSLPENAFSDVDGDDLTLSAKLEDGSDLPEWLAFDPNDGSFSGTPPLNFNGALMVTVTAADAGGLEAYDTFELNITPVNDAPQLDNPTADQTSEEDTAVSFSLPENAFSDVDGDDLTLSAKLEDGSDLPEWLAFDPNDGSFSGTPPLNFNGALMVTVTAADAGGLEAYDTFELNITPVNDAPQLDNPTADQTSEEDTAVSFSLPENAFSDVDGDDLTLSAKLEDGSDLPEWLAFDPNDGSFSGTPPLNFNGALMVTVTAADAGGLEAYDTFELNITPVNDAPQLDNPTADQTSEEDTAVSFSLPENAFSDVDGDDLTLSAKLEDGSDLPEWLAFDPNDGSFSGTPPLNFNGALMVTVTAADAGGLEAYDTFELNITPVNDAPQLDNPTADQTSEEDTAVSFSLPENAFSDVDGDDLTLSAKLEDGSDLPEWLAFDPNDGSFSGTPPLNFNGALMVTVTAADAGGLEAYDTFELNITPVNDAPQLDNPTADQTSEEDTAVSFSLPENAFSDVDGDDLTLSAKLEDGSDLPEWLAFDPNDGSFSGTPPLNFNGALMVTVTAADAGGLEAYDTFELNITPVNDAPQLDNPTADQTSEEDTAVSFSLPENAFSDVDGDDLTLSAKLEDGSDLPEWLAFDPNDGSFSGTPPLNFNGALMVTVTAADAGGLEAYDTFELNITPVNDAPQLDNPTADQTSEEDTAVSFSLPENAFSDVDGDDLTLSAKLEDGSDLPEWLAFDPNDGSFSGTPPLNFNGALMVTVTAADAGGLEAYDTFELNITPVNDAPQLDNPTADQTSEEDTAVSFSLPENAFSDVDGDDLTYRTSTLPAWLAFDASTLTFSGTPPTNYNGITEVTVTASDADGLEVSDTFALEITPVNDSPVAVNDEGFEATAGEEQIISAVDLLANDTDVEGDDLNIISVESTSGNADVSLGEDGNVVYTASEDFDGDDSFTYTISDGNGGTATATVNVTVEEAPNPYEGWQVGTGGRDNLYGNFYSSNQIYGDAGNDRIYGGYRDDQLDGGEGHDRIYGRWGNDIINGNEGNDSLYGGWGNDILNGGEGNDRISGGWGNDIISGGQGNDQIWGGWGEDNFIFNTGDGADTIRDFSTGFNWWWYRSAGDTITLDVDGIENYNDLLDVASQSGSHTTFDFGDDDSLTLRNTRLSSLDQDDFTIL